MEKRGVYENGPRSRWVIFRLDKHYESDEARHNQTEEQNERRNCGVAGATGNQYLRAAA